MSASSFSSSSSSSPSPSSCILLTGASGYVGGRLLNVLARDPSLSIRCLARRSSFLSEHPNNVSVVQGDVLRRESLTVDIFRGVDVAFYMVHSMGAPGSFEELDRLAAANFGSACSAAGVKRIVYLGGLANENSSDLSAHFRSRFEVGHILRQSNVPVIELRASIVLGAGSTSYELIRAIVEKVPVLLTPPFVDVRAQPIGIEDLLAYLVLSIRIPMADQKKASKIQGNSNNNNNSLHRIYEIGGKNDASYGDIMQEYAKQRHLWRPLVKTALITPWLSKTMLKVVAPKYADVGACLMESLNLPTVIRDRSAEQDFAVKPMTYQEAIARAMTMEDEEIGASVWNRCFLDGVSSKGNMSALACSGLGRRFFSHYSVETRLSPDQVFSVVNELGTSRGFYFADGLWHLRAWMELVVGGSGIRAWRPDASIKGRPSLKTGDSFACFVVEKFVPNRQLRLDMTLLMPGRGWLEISAEPNDKNQLTTVNVVAMYDPVGVIGLLYWFFVLPLHGILFPGLLHRIVYAAEAEAEAKAPPSMVTPWLWTASAGVSSALLFDTLASSVVRAHPSVWIGAWFALAFFCFAVSFPVIALSPRWPHQPLLFPAFWYLLQMVAMWVWHVQKCATSEFAIWIRMAVFVVFAMAFVGNWGRNPLAAAAIAPLGIWQLMN